MNASEAEMGEIAVAQRGAGRGHQHTVDGGHQAAKQRSGDGCSLGHCRPLFKRAADRRIMVWGQSTYTRYQSQRLCLHGSILSFAMQHRIGNQALRAGRTGKKEAAGAGGL